MDNLLLHYGWEVWSFHEIVRLLTTKYEFDKYFGEEYKHLLSRKIKISEKNKKFINNSRNEIINILEKKDKRKLVVMGPCSIHDVKVLKNMDYL